MAFFLRATTPDLAAEEYFKLVKKPDAARTILGSATTAFFLLLVFLLFAAAQISGQHNQQTDLVSDVAGMAAATDPDLVNPWGLISSPTGPWWVADNGTGVSTLYNGAGVKQSLVVTVATPPGDTDPATPTGIVFNGTAGFPVGTGP